MEDLGRYEPWKVQGLFSRRILWGEGGKGGRGEGRGELCRHMSGTCHVRLPRYAAYLRKFLPEEGCSGPHVCFVFFF
jgi:hypothetical protein